LAALPTYDWSRLAADHIKTRIADRDIDLGGAKILGINFDQEMTGGSVDPLSVNSSPTADNASSDPFESRFHKFAEGAIPTCYTNTLDHIIAIQRIIAIERGAKEKSPIIFSSR
jgi:hypothetical protein